LLEEHGQVPNIHPMPAVMRIEDKTLNIHDFWNRTDEKSDDSDGGIRASDRAL